MPSTISQAIAIDSRHLFRIIVYYRMFRYVLLYYMSIMACLQAIRLTPLQVEQVLIWREEHLRNMLAVYEQRQQLNVEVIFFLSVSHRFALILIEP